MQVRPLLGQLDTHPEAATTCRWAGSRNTCQGRGDIRKWPLQRNGHYQLRFVAALTLKYCW
jgi:hypothetical protein